MDFFPASQLIRIKIDEISEIKYVPQKEELLEVRTKKGRVLLRYEKGVCVQDSRLLCDHCPGMKLDRFYDINPERFEVKTADRVDNVNTRIDPKWVGIWMTVVFYKLLKKLPNQWVHLPAGSACKEIALNELVLSVKVNYQQHQRIYV